MRREGGRKGVGFLELELEEREMSLG